MSVRTRGSLSVCVAVALALTILGAAPAAAQSAAQLPAAKDLIAKREEIDTQLAELFAGAETSRRPYRRRKAEENGVDLATQSVEPALPLDANAATER